MDFIELSVALHKQRKTPLMNDSVYTLCFDPGHTTGWCVFSGHELLETGQIDTTDIPKATQTIGDLFKLYSPHIIVLEDYRIYKWRAKHHAGSDVLTTRVIGCIETLATVAGITTIIKQPAHIAKGFCTDTKLREWGFYLKGERHARDAIRHGCYFLLFGAISKKQRQGVTVG